MLPGGLVVEMLSIGKLVAGQARYYLDQAEGRVDVVESVGEGLEDYYVEGQEARGEWIGATRREFALGRSVEPVELRRLLAAVDPCDGRPLRQVSRATRVAAFDLTYSAPKSVSVLFAVGDRQMRREVRAAHDTAVREAVAYLERNAAAVRRGHGGLVVEQAPGLVAAAFRHRTSRSGDPQLHTHVLVANFARGSDGRWLALDGRRIYAHARAASFVYQAVLRGELTRRLGIEWSPVRKGIAEVVGVPRPVLREFSRRRADIEAALKERGTSGARAAEAAALATRRVKDATVRPEDLVSEWRARAEALGLGRDELALIVGRGVPLPLDAEMWTSIFDRLARSDGLTRRSPTFTRKDVLLGVCELLPPGANVDARLLEAAADGFLASGRAVALLPDAELGAESASYRRRDGRLMPLAVHEMRYSTPEQLSLERRFMDRAVGSTGARAGTATAGDVERALATRPALSGAQLEAVESLCLGGERVAVVAGRAGTGKTYALAAAREAWQAAGHPVLGVAVARRAAAELRDSAGIESTSIAALLADLRVDRGRRLPDRCVLVVDEAGMASTRQLSELLDHVERVGGKLVLVGDDRQLPELEAGGAFHALVRRGLAVELVDNVRQIDAWEREALDHLREGRPDEALELYAAHGRVVVEPSADASRERLVEDWWAAGERDRAVMVARRRVDVADLNARARARMRDVAAVDGPELRLPGGDFAVGDRVVVKRNDMRVGVNNGDRGRVVAVEPEAGALTLLIEERRVRLGGDFLLGRTDAGDPTLVHGYAITGHVAQGLTVQDALVLADEGVSREWAYVALSRGRESNRLYLAAAPDDPRVEFAPQEQQRAGPIQRLASALRSSGAQVLAIDSGRPLEGPSNLAVAQRELDQARKRRSRLEHQHLGWLPQRREQLDAARREEAAAEAAVVRVRAERQHGSLGFVEEREREAQRDRVNERVHRRDRGIERER
jgi:conjugative relaxase-like TrwC/TraI family protein